MGRWGLRAFLVKKAPRRCMGRLGLSVGLGTGELFCRSEEGDFPGRLLCSLLPCVQQVDDNEIGGQAPLGILAVIIELDSLDVLWLARGSRKRGSIRYRAGDDLEDGDPGARILVQWQANLEFKRTYFLSAVFG